MAIPKIKLTKCNPDTVRTTLDSLKLTTDGSTKAIVARLATYYDDNGTKLDIAGCDVCNADSDANLDACPFCGTEGEVDESGVPPAATPSDEQPPPKKKKAAKKKAAAKTTKTKKLATAASKKKAKAKPKGRDADLADGHPRKPTDKAKPPPKKAAKKKAAAKPKAAAPTPDVASATLVTVKDLDKQVAIIQGAVCDGAVALHRLGVAAKIISDGGLWKMRTAKGDVPAYRNFKQFCSEDLGMSSVHIYRAMGVADQFTEDDIIGLSGAQVRVVMQLPKDAQQAALDAAKAGEGTSALSERASALRGTKGAATPPPKKAVTVAVAMGIQKVPMFKRPTKRGAKVGDTDNATPATSLSEKPWLAIELTNKVRLLVRLDTNKDGELTASVEFRRGEQAI